jgi:hypothetical protein
LDFAVLCTASDIGVDDASVTFYYLQNGQPTAEPTSFTFDSDVPISYVVVYGDIGPRQYDPTFGGAPVTEGTVIYIISSVVDFDSTASAPCAPGDNGVKFVPGSAPVAV